MFVEVGKRGAGVEGARNVMPEARRSQLGVQWLYHRLYSRKHVIHGEDRNVVVLVEEARRGLVGARLGVASARRNNPPRPHRGLSAAPS
jgi:hypothetical protein